MNTSSAPPAAELRQELQRAYEMRFANQKYYRDAVWRILVADFFQRFISPNATVLDLGCGWGEFINNVTAAKKYAMDLNPDASHSVAADVTLFEQDCTQEWPVPDESLDCIFTSNFFEHLRTKDDLRSTLLEIRRCLRSSGRLICIGPNIRYLPGTYWDFWDHYLPLSDRSLREILELSGFRIERCISRFLPYHMSRRRPVPLQLVRLYTRLPFVWKIFGKQFLLIAAKS